MTVREKLEEIVKREEAEYDKMSFYEKAERMVHCGECPVYTRCDEIDVGVGCDEYFEKYADTPAEFNEEEYDSKRVVN